MIKVKNLSKDFGALAALRDVSFTLGKGKSLAIIGPTAAGKSVLLKCLVGLYAADSGTIALFGAPPAQNAEQAARVGMLFQQNALFDSLPIWENIAFRLINNGQLTRAAARARAEELLPRVGLPVAAADLYPSDLSGGMQKRVGFARAIATQPDILLLDNPTAGLDPILAARIDRMIASLARESGATVISVTGNIVGITKAYDEIAVMHDGQMRWHGSAVKAKTDKNKFLRQLLAGSREGPITSLAAVPA